MKKDKQLHLRISENEKNEIEKIAENFGYSNISRFIIDSVFNKVENRKISKMKVHTLTLSPTLDYLIKLDKEVELYGPNVFEFDQKKIQLGGRGINTSIILKKFNIPSIAVHYSSGFTGEHIYNLLEDKGVEQYKISSKKSTRINFNITTPNKSFSFEEKRTKISEYGKMKIRNYISNNLSKGEYFILSGSFVDDDYIFIREISKMINDLEVNLIYNLSNKVIINLIEEFKPYLVMYDNNNLDGKNTRNNIIEFINTKENKYAENVIFIYDYRTIFAKIDQKEIFDLNYNEENEQVVFVGLRDAFIAGFIGSETNDNNEKVKWGFSTLVSHSTSFGEYSFEDVLLLLKKLE